MDVVKAVETYITKLVSVPSAMKVLLLDTHTVGLLVSVDMLKITLFLDTHRLFGFYAVNTSVPSSLPNGSDRQQKSRSYAAYEMRLLPTTE